MQTAQYRVAIIEDEPTTRQRIREAVDIHPEFEVIGDVANCAQGRPLIQDHQPDVLLVDLGLPDGHGTELIRLAQTASPKTEIMVITVFGDERNVLSAIEAGATSYLLKDSDSDHIGQAIKQMLDGGSPISASIARHLLKRFRPDPAPANNDEEKISLTQREREVLELVAKGLSYSEIGETLGMSVHTVTSHIKHIYRKLSVNSRGEAVFEAAQLGLIKPISRL